MAVTMSAMAFNLVGKTFTASMKQNGRTTTASMTFKAGGELTQKIVADRTYNATGEWMCDGNEIWTASDFGSDYFVVTEHPDGSLTLQSYYSDGSPMMKFTEKKASTGAKKATTGKRKK